MSVLTAERPAEAEVDTSKLSKDDVFKIGKTIGGSKHWQADLGRQVGYSKSMITRFLNGTRPTTPLLARGLKRVIIGKLAELSKLLILVGLPRADDPETVRAQALITEALAILRKQEEIDD